MSKTTSSKIDFTNDLRRVRRGKGCYGFEWRHDSKTLARLHGCRELLQAILSQAGAYLLTGKFHDFWNFTVGKAEGGFAIPRRGEFIPTQDCMAMDPPSRRIFRLTADKDCEKLAELLTHIALKWDASRHEDSMYEVAARYAGTTLEALRSAVENNANYRTRIALLTRRMAFGDPISYFFGWNTKVPYDAEYRDYWLKSSAAIPRIVGEVQKSFEPKVESDGDATAEAIKVMTEIACPNPLSSPDRRRRKRMALNKNRMRILKPWRTRRLRAS